jgi:hypothetical protein
MPYCKILKANRPKSKSISSTSTRSSNNAESKRQQHQPLETHLEAADLNEQQQDELEESFEQNEAITRIEELLEYLLSASASANHDDSMSSAGADTSSLNGITFTAASNNQTTNQNQQNEASFSVAQMPTYTYAELLALYEKERNLRYDMEATFQQKTKESNKQVILKR